MSEVQFTEVVEYVKESAHKARPKYADLVMRIVGNGLNHYHRLKVDLENLGPVSINGEKYELKQESFFLVEYNIFQRFGRWFKKKVFRRRLTDTFHTVYLEGEESPLIADAPPEGEPTSRLLMIIRESTALKRGISELFRAQLAGRQLLVILIIFGVVVFAILVLTGTVDLSGVM